MPERKTPQVRFKGFTDTWEQRKLGDVCQVTMGQSPDGSTYSDTPSDYILVQGNADLKDGWVSPRIWTTQKTKTAEDGDLIMSVRAPAGSMGKTSYNVVLGRGVAGIKGNEFIYQSLVKMDSNGYWKKLAAGSTFESINSDVVNGAELMVPQDIDEQNKIGDYFASIDALITLHQREGERLQMVKKSMLENCLPKNGEKVPRFRFAGFTGDWEQRKLAEVFTYYSDPVDIPHEGYERLGIRSHAKGTFHSYVPAGHELQTAQMHRVAANKFIVNITFGWEHAVAVTDENDAGKLVSHRFPQFSLSEEIDPKFLKFIILDENFRHHLWLASPGGAGRNRVLNLTEMLQYEIQIPTVVEQKQIADVLINLDTLITLHQSELEMLKKIKESMLGKMLV